jgi:hypothetical protein
LPNLLPFPAELAITIANGEVWLAIGLALLLGVGCLAFGIWVSRTVGLLRLDAPAGEILGVGLGAGLMVLAAWWAAIWSGGRSSFTPVAVGFAIAIAFAIARRARRVRGPSGVFLEGHRLAGKAKPLQRSRRTSFLLTGTASSVFIVAVALLYGSTMVRSARDGLQPVEFNDEAFYSVLGRDVANTGIENNLSASGFPQADLAGLPSQTWYHWGEIWLSSWVITIFGTTPIAARYFVVLPIVLLAAATLTGTLVRRATRTGSRRAFLFGCASCLFLAPIPVIPGPFFSFWAVGMIFGITLYGLSAVAVLLALYGVTVLGSRDASWPLAGYVASVVAFILPAHIAVALLALVGTFAVWAIRITRSILAARMPTVSAIWRRTLFASSVLIVVTVAWGILTGHSVGGGDRSSSTLVSPFNESWRASVLIVMLGSGLFLAILVAWPFLRRAEPSNADLYAGTVVLLVAGAILWGARIADFTMFYLFFAGIAVIATPVAAIAVRALWERLRATRHLRLAFGLVVLCVVQLDFGVVAGIFRLQSFGPYATQPSIPVKLLDAIRRLPSHAELAYACQPFEEVAFGTPRLISIDAHTSRRVVPMCFTAEVLSVLTGGNMSDHVPSLYFQVAPQRALYPNVTARPSSAAVTGFLRDHGIDYIYADPRHPNSLVDDAIPIVVVGEFKILRIP